MENSKKTPQRKCIGCGMMKDKNNMIRVIRTKEGLVEVDVTGKKNGRGAYLCRGNPDCLKKAIKSKALERALKTDIPDDLKALLAKESEGF